MFSNRVSIMESRHQLNNDIQIHKFIDKILASFYLLKLWNVSDETSSVRSNAMKWLQLLFFAVFVLSMAGGACLSTDTDEIIFLIVAAMINGVIVYRMAIIIGRKNEILAFVKEFGRHTVNDPNDFTLINADVEYLIKFAKAFVAMCAAGVTFALFVPLFSSGKKLVFNIALPPQWKDNALVFWIAHFYSVIACTYSSHSLLLSVVIWTVDRFTACFGNLFFLQISTSGICITGSIYTLAFVRGRTQMTSCFFSAVIRLKALITRQVHSEKACKTYISVSSERNILQNGIYCVFISYSLFDIFTLMFLGNELKLSSDRLSYCLFESDWIETAHLDRTSIFILGEVLRQPRELVVGRVYPLNLKTFSKILNGAYSMFNILKTVK